VTTDVAIRARAVESIYRQIYSVIIRSAIARAPGDGKDNHVNEIPNVSILASASSDRRETRLGILRSSSRMRFSETHSISPESAHEIELFVSTTGTVHSETIVGYLFEVFVRGSGELTRKRGEPQNAEKQTTFTRLSLRSETVETSPNFSQQCKVKGGALVVRQNRRDVKRRLRFPDSRTTFIATDKDRA